MTLAFIEAHQFSNILNWHSYERQTDIFLKDLLRRYYCFSFIYFFFRFSQLESVSESAAVSSARKWLFCDNMSTYDHSDTHREYVTKIRIT